MPLRILCLCVTALLLFGCNAEEDAAKATLPLTSCELVTGRTARCGTLTVPENYSEENGRTIDLNIAVIPAQDRSVQPDPIFMLAGGPGQSAVEAFPFVLSFYSQLNQSRDIVLVDQRGTGQSNPLACPALQDLPFDTPEKEVYDLLDACQETLAQDNDLTQYITDIAMRDLDNIREALGYDQINLFGTSYGSRAAMRYMQLYPDRVRTAVLNAVTSPELVIYLQSPADGQRALDLLFERCASDAACSTAFPNLEVDFERMLTNLGDGRDVQLTHPQNGKVMQVLVTPDSLIQGIFSILYSPDLVSLLPLLITNTVKTGDYAPLVGQLIALSQSAGIYQGLFYAVACSEDAPLIALDDAEARRGDAQFPLLADDLLTVCEAWPKASSGLNFREPLNSDIPTLLLSGDADPITPPAYAEQVAAGLSNRAKILLPGYGHDISTVGCIPDVITDFIQSGTHDDLDTGCVANIVPPPFFITAAGPQP